MPINSIKVSGYQKPREKTIPTNPKHRPGFVRSLIKDNRLVNFSGSALSTNFDIKLPSIFSFKEHIESDRCSVASAKCDDIMGQITSEIAHAF